MKKILLLLVAVLAFSQVFNGEAYLHINSKLVAMIMIVLMAIILILEFKQNKSMQNKN
ncbi:hypothetical protein SK066_10075 [Paenibacillus hunanensis]|uniref:hypothetical protein n=1 Tax=Paenibacillus hunanensis TaxID=539262 RepID=UPI0020264970|nr:hypothetical protein [Paenibacillus hunanensis]MCL9662618.1 hypothetical protein [Paenibacillus hunanensis]WPP43246.1 hypothetical protein SK066_10075 [Paenibacillus hunanensis]